MGVLRKLAVAVAAAAAAGAVAAVTGCGERSEPLETSVSPYPVTVQGAGDRPTTLARRPTRIAPLDPTVATLLIELDAQKQLVGLPRPGGAPSIWRLSGARLVRRLVLLRPDLIVASSATDPVDLARAGRETKAAVYLLPEESVLEISRAATGLGLLTDHSVRARALIRANRQAQRRVAAAVAGTPIVRVFVDTGGFTTISSETLLSDVVRIGRGRNVVGAHPEPGVFSLRLLARLDPQVYLTTDRQTTLHALRKNRKTRGLSAIRTGRFAHIPLRYLRPDADLSERLLAVARLLHPDAFR